MAPKSQPRRVRSFVRACIISCCLLATCAGQATEHRPSLSAACRAWNSHIAELIDQHRTAHELDDDQLGEIIRLFYEAQHICSAQRFEEGVAIYETIPVGPIASRRLR